MEVSKLEMNQPLGSSYLTAHSEKLSYPTKGLNLLKESECRASVQIVLCNSFLYTNNIQKYYSVSRCVIFIIIMIAPTSSFAKHF